MSDSFEIGCAVQSVPTAQEERNQVACHISAGNIEATGEMVENNRLVDRDNVGYSVSRVNDNS